MSQNVCPKDCKVCIDDMCRGSGVCALTGTELWETCDRCHGVYSDEFGVSCACEPADEYREEASCDGCGQLEDDCLCSVDLDDVMDCNSVSHPGCPKCEIT